MILPKSNPIVLAAALIGLGTCVLSAAQPSTLPTVTVTDSDEVIAHDVLSGPYNQPEWTEHRIFGTTRVYIQQEPGEIGFEQWWRPRTFNDGPPSHRFIEELEIGLPNRFQLDLYYKWLNKESKTYTDEVAVELRWALADWGVIPFNPTLYLEYAFVNNQHGGDVIEAKLLLGDNIGKNWQWGLNFIFESEVSQALTKKVAVAGGLNYSFSPRLAAGIEAQWAHETVAGGRADPEIQFQVGPSMQYRLSKTTHLDLVCLFGCTKESPQTESYLIFGWDFGGSEAAVPSSGGKNPKGVRNVNPTSSDSPDRYTPVAGRQL
ncbi:MAG: hypothetical protein JWO08_3962 [Verrucomicrobiaceae bacterium]|nr:hypothetical protein [Verrucomicrobiaceae bacterium]